MVLGVGEQEVEFLEKRFEEFRRDYPDLRLVERDELSILEPNVVKGRDPNIPIIALVSNLGYAVNYQKLSEAFVEDARSLNEAFECFFDTKVKSVKRVDGLYTLETNNGTFHAKVVVFATGPYSLRFAQKFGYGRHYGILNLKGDFYSAMIPDLVNNKVYRPQEEGVSYAEPHADPDVLDGHITRFGPTTIPIPLMQPGHYETFFEWLQTGSLSPSGILAIWRILMADNMLLLKFAFKSVLYKVPALGKYIFLRETRQIIPTLRYRDIVRRKNAGGVRPQVFDKRTGKLLFGETTIYGENSIFITTPSPGATSCLTNAEKMCVAIEKFLGEGYSFDDEGFKRQFGPVPGNEDGSKKENLSVAS